MVSSSIRLSLSVVAVLQSNGREIEMGLRGTAGITSQTQIYTDNVMFGAGILF